MASLLRYPRNVVKMFFRFSEINFHAPQTKGSREGALFRRYYFVTTGSTGLNGLLYEPGQLHALGTGDHLLDRLNIRSFRRPLPVMALGQSHGDGLLRPRNVGPFVVLIVLKDNIQARAVRLALVLDLAGGVDLGKLLRRRINDDDLVLFLVIVREWVRDKGGLSAISETGMIGGGVRGHDFARRQVPEQEDPLDIAAARDVALLGIEGV